MESTAGIGIVVKYIVALAVFYRYRIAVAVISAEESILVTVVGGNRCAAKTDKTLSVVAACGILAYVLIDALDNLVAEETGSGNEQGVL